MTFKKNLFLHPWFDEFLSISRDLSLLQKWHIDRESHRECLPTRAICRRHPIYRINPKPNVICICNATGIWLLYELERKRPKSHPAAAPPSPLYVTYRKRYCRSDISVHKTWRILFILEIYVLFAFCLFL